MNCSTKGPAIKHDQLPFASCAPTCMPHRARQLLLRLLFHIVIVFHLLSGHAHLFMTSRKGNRKYIFYIEYVNIFCAFQCLKSMKVIKLLLVKVLFVFTCNESEAEALLLGIP